MYYRGSAAAVIVYDITKLVSLWSLVRLSCSVCVTLVIIRGQKYIFHVQLWLLCPCHQGLFPNAEEVGEGVEGTRARGHSGSHHREQEWFRRHQVGVCLWNVISFWWHVEKEQSKTRTGRFVSAGCEVEEEQHWELCNISRSSIISCVVQGTKAILTNCTCASQPRKSL